MKKFVLASILFASSALNSMAADLPVKAPVAPAIAPTWAGWYVGLNGGGAWAGVSPSSTVINSNNAAIFPNGSTISQVEAAGSTNIKRSSVFEGAQIGYLAQWGNVVAGVEAGFDWMGIDTLRSERIPYAVQNCGVGQPTPCFFHTTNRGFNSDWMFTLLGRVGLAYGPVLPYLTGGLAVSELSYRYSFNNANNIPSFAQGATSASSTQVGFAVGAGVDYQVAPNWTVRGEYLFVQFDGLSATTPALAGGATTTAISVSSGQFRENIGRIAVSYRFGGGGSSPLTAMAAYLPVKAAPPPAPVASWTGFYTGVHGGAAWSHSGDWSFVDPNGVEFTPAPPVGSHTSQAAALVGLHAGYNWQFAPTWVLGIEGDYSWSNLSDNRVQTPLRLGAGPALTPNTTLAMKTDTRGLASVRGRLGYVGWANTLFYATGGVAWEQRHFTGTLNNIPPSFATDFLAVANTGKTSTGWVAGAGAEAMVAPHVLVRAEYLYYGFNNSGATAQANLQPNPGAFPLPFVFNWASQNVQVVRLGASYKF